MYGLQIRQLVIIRIDTDTEEQPGVASIDDLQRTKFDEVGLMFLISRRDEPVDFAL